MADIGPLTGVLEISKSFGAQALFEQVSFNLFPGDRLGIIGPNGSGKTTLLRILAGHEVPDSGLVVTRRDVKLGYVPQEATFEPGLTARSVLHQALMATGRNFMPNELEALIGETLGKTGFEDLEQPVSTMSGGWLKRQSIAKELVLDPDVLLLDEPTNHLDLPGLTWLEDLLRRSRFASLIVSHDRWFLENVATRMIELNKVYPQGTLAATGPYSDFLEARQLFLENQAKEQQTLENKVRREVEWLKRGPKARATKAQYRIDAAHALLDALDEVTSRNTTATVKFDFGATARRTKRLMTVRNLAKTLGERELFKSLSFVLSPGVRVALVGANGSGKTTLLRILANELEPDSGRIESADGLKVVYFDQRLQKLDLDQTLRQALAPDGDAVSYRGAQVHISSWAKRFLFRQDQLTTPLRALSGGERARVMIAKLVTTPADILLLDEPTNDLDLATLEVLEDSLLDFPGAIILVTHDRYMLDKIATTVLGLDGQGGAAFYGDYAQWQRDIAVKSEPEKEPRVVRERPSRPKRLTWKEQRDYETIEERIALAEEKLAKLLDKLHDPSIATNAIKLAECSTAVEEAQAEVDTLFTRWAELEEKVQG
ncbi:MAG TPA: ABC-F family ATP-binding cassette domain-containing protein [Myxococcota bacterium]|mgnify:CR=1 FL=1|nr:ABC-F family ATP-binding cassette domain-containing protein [Myxococcota bacterium]HON25125.1 ABC-F family ATP-binding cassette domain-containing protein [Myxococcota bacterium]HOS62575.1 ABC-F family ATP-binding cassette domain-containing protein [Myxococcota bacterium]HPC92363.1 ABC-F family ATP-binding cassette domain-containing protein [Myxococcota bacterium]HPL25722.1 ABC-F family ATP-binding cassette domain-containing protein [Myxococcota bacterium]